MLLEHRVSTSYILTSWGKNGIKKEKTSPIEKEENIYFGNSVFKLEMVWIPIYEIIVK